MKGMFNSDKILWKNVKPNSSALDESVVCGVVKRRTWWAYMLYDFSTTWFITQKLSNKSYSVWVQRSTTH